LLLSAWYYTTFDYWDTAQTESCEALCVLGAWFCAMEARERSRFAWAAGACLGLGFSFKFTALCFALPLAYTLWPGDAGSQRFKSWALRSAAAAGGGLLVIAAWALYFWWRGALADMLDVIIGLNSVYASGWATSWSEALSGIHPATPPEDQARIRAIIVDIETYLRGVLADRRRARRNDLVSDLLDAEVDGDQLGEAELISFLAIILQGGHHTTASLLSSSLRFLAGEPELLAHLRAEPAATPAFVEEMLRFDSPLQGSLRLVVSDTEIAGVSLPAGAIVLALIGSANRDDRRIVDPDCFDLDRRRSAHLTFGHGAHFCIGAALARAQGRFGLEELLPRVRGLRVHERGAAWGTSLFSRSHTHLWMEIDPV